MEKQKELNFVQERRQGIFSINFKTIENHPEIVQKFLSQFVIIRAEAMFFDSSIEYKAFSEKFPICGLMNKAPHFYLDYLRDEKGNLTRLDIILGEK